MHPWEETAGITLERLREHQQRELLREELDELLDEVESLFQKPGNPYEIEYDKAIPFLNEVLAESHFCDYHLEEKDE